MPFVRKSREEELPKVDYFKEKTKPMSFQAFSETQEALKPVRAQGKKPVADTTDIGGMYDASGIDGTQLSPTRKTGTVTGQDVRDFGRQLPRQLEAGASDLSVGALSTLRAINRPVEALTGKAYQAVTGKEMAPSVIETGLTKGIEKSEEHREAFEPTRSFGEQGDVALGAVRSLPQMGPALLGAGPGLALGTIGASAFGGSAREAEKAGASQLEQTTAGLGSAMTEIATEYLPVKNVGKFVGGTGTVKDLALNMVEEFVGEAVSEALSPVIETTYNKNAVNEAYVQNLDETLQRIKQAGYTGAVASLMIGGAAAGIGSVNNAINNPSEENLNAVADEIEQATGADVSGIRESIKAGPNIPTMQAMEPMMESPFETDLVPTRKSADAPTGQIAPEAQAKAPIEALEGADAVTEMMAEDDVSYEVAPPQTVASFVQEDTVDSPEVQEITNRFNEVMSGPFATEAQVDAAEAVVQELNKRGGRLKMNLQVFAEALDSIKEMRISKFGQNIATDKNMDPKLRKFFEENPLEHVVAKEADTLEKAQDIYNQGYAEARVALNNAILNAKNVLKPESVVLAKLLANDAISRGDMESARNHIADMSEMLTMAGQFTEAARILRETSDAATVLKTVMRDLKRLNAEGKQRYGELRNRLLLPGKKGWKNIELTKAEEQMIQEMDNLTPEQKEAQLAKLYKGITNRIPTTIREKIDAWRRMAMLLNPKTHLRNILGNSVMFGLSEVSDAISTGIESVALPEDQRTKVIRATDQYRNTAKEHFAENSQDILRGSRWELLGVGSPFMDKKIFNTKVLEKINQFSKDTLDKEDIVFLSHHYVNSLAKFMQARGVNEVTPDAHQYALRRAKEATFRQQSDLADYINKAKQIPIAGVAVEAAIPFTKTPVNIAKTGAQYSPFGTVEAVGKFLSGDKAMGIEALGKSITGTGLAALGFWMAMNGIARGDYDKEKEAILSQKGQLPNSVKTPNGSYTIDWVQPAAVPFFMGVAVYEMMEENEKTGIIDIMAESGATGLDVIINQSMLQGISNLLSNEYGRGPGTKIMSLPLDYLTQMFPTALGQWARTQDPTKRQRDYATPTSAAFTGMQARTPFASERMPAKFDILGEEQTYGEGPMNFIQQFISPGTIGTETDDPTMEEIIRLYDEVGEDAIPRYNKNKFTYDKQTIQMTPEERSAFQQIMGQYTKQEFSDLMEKGKYDRWDDKKKTDELMDINKDGYEEAKEAIIRMRGGENADDIMNEILGN